LNFHRRELYDQCLTAFIAPCLKVNGMRRGAFSVQVLVYGYLFIFANRAGQHGRS